MGAERRFIEPLAAENHASRGRLYVVGGGVGFRVRVYLAFDHSESSFRHELASKIVGALADSGPLPPRRPPATSIFVDFGFDVCGFRIRFFFWLKNFSVWAKLGLKKLKKLSVWARFEVSYQTGDL